MSHRAFGVLVVLLAASCRGDTGSIPDVSGTWSYGAPSLKSGALECGLTGVTLILDQTGASFVGTYAGGVLTCDSSSESGFIGEVVGGTVAGPQVQFDFDNTDWTNSGRLAGTTMTGQTIWTVGIGSTVYQLVGTWTATKN